MGGQHHHRIDARAQPQKPSREIGFQRVRTIGELCRKSQELPDATADIPPYIAPICSPPSSGFGNRVDPFTGRLVFHAGLDFEVPIGTLIFASAAGKIIAAEERSPYGLLIEIDHGGAHKTRYGHLSELAVKAGDNVAQGTVIAKIRSDRSRANTRVTFRNLAQRVVQDPRKELQSNPSCAASVK